MVIYYIATMQSGVQNIELHLLFENDLKNKWFIQFWLTRLNIMNFMGGITTLKSESKVGFYFFNKSISY